VDIEADTTVAMGFEDQVARAVKALVAIEGIDQATAESLVKHGFATVEGILEAEVDDIAEIPEIGHDKAQVIVDAARAHGAKQGEGGAEKTEEPHTQEQTS
jgi:transcription termination factor NusA